MELALISLIVAHDKKRGIGFKQHIPWFLPGELRWVAQKTKETNEKGQINALIMGKNTWYSLPESRRPLVDRLNIVISTTETIPHDDVLTFKSLGAAIDYVKGEPNIHTSFIFGGASIYNHALQNNLVDEAIISEVQLVCESDTFFPEMPGYLHLLSTEFVTYGETEVIRRIYKKQK